MNDKTQVSCPVRCLEAEDVAAARQRLRPGGTVRVAYDCKACAEVADILLASDEVCAAVAGREGIDSPLAAKLLLALIDRELCECDLATLMGGPEAPVLAELARLEQGGRLARREDDYMIYYHLAEEDFQDRLRTRLHMVAKEA
ncbi:hypothetical protein JCM17960_10690 [Magnetospira thiophila]